MQGCAPELRVEVWPYLLRLDSPSASREQRAKLRSQLTESYAALLQRCQVIVLCIFPSIFCCLSSLTNQILSIQQE